ncbi:uncharacterized protein BO96DRAFT_465140 [Aspergillus niger CBS 101883]|uniref:uncharacterized protein n=1 Tax=Aspergillus lacticoffeatus (strain CBS 101883) TaxID=1450533 RepID=UPI000D7EFE64|nr:uncharacterized protein BO96DRAFT_465140 [Aspergillus niger CBS 101883]PYH57510.1 hypothetical protein BO96DRAFT_465140 [Aspergillus niger CBS 101883]
MPAEVHTHTVSTPHAAGREQNSKAEARSNSQCTVGVSAVSMRTHERGHLALRYQRTSTAYIYYQREHLPAGYIADTSAGKHPQQKSKDTSLRPLLSDMIPHDRYGEVTNTTKNKNPCQHRARQERPRHVYAFSIPSFHTAPFLPPDRTNCPHTCKKSTASHILQS